MNSGSPIGEQDDARIAGTQALGLDWPADLLSRANEAIERSIATTASGMRCMQCMEGGFCGDCGAPLVSRF